METKAPRRRHPFASGDGDEALDQERMQLERIARGDTRAYRAVVDNHYRGMYAFALRLVGNKSEAEDLVQESFARAFSRWHQFDASYRLSTWLYRIVLNSCRDHLKSPRRREQLVHAQHFESDQQPNGSNVDPWSAHECIESIHAALSRLRPKYGEILVLKDLLGFSYEEIHELTGTPVPGLKIRAVRARDCLRALLQADGE